MHLGEIIHHLYKSYGREQIKLLYVELPYGKLTVDINEERIFIELTNDNFWSDEGLKQLDTLKVYQVEANIMVETKEAKKISKLLTDNLPYYQPAELIAKN